MKITRASLINTHLVLASFFFPFAVMFLITGALYTIAIKGSAVTREETVSLQIPLKPDLATLVTVATAELNRLGIDPPSGEASIRKVGSSFQLEWSGVDRDINLKPTTNTLEAKLEVKENTAYKKLVQLHKAKGNAFARTVSVIWAIGLALIFLSGIVTAWASPKHRRLAAASGAAGMLLFALYYLLG